MKEYRLFVVTTPGLENIALREMLSLGLVEHADDARIEVGGIEFSGTDEALYRANLYLHTATRVLVRLKQFYAIHFPELRRKASRIPWEWFIHKDQPLVFRVSCHKSRLYHSDGVMERIVAGIGDRLGAPPPVLPEGEMETEDPPQLVVVRFFRNECTISVDSSGAALYRRGYRKLVSEAPLRETLAAAMIMESGWDQSSPLIDPFCGSGTIPIEAARLACKLPPGVGRGFAFLNWPVFNSQLWESMVEQAKNKVILKQQEIVGIDINEKVIEAAISNAKRAGVESMVSFRCMDSTLFHPPARNGWVITNPPYGVRTRTGRSRVTFYQKLNQMLLSRFQGYRLAMLLPDEKLINRLSVVVEKKIPLNNGGIRVVLLIGRVD
ncbi:MAG: class I SAM-dependent RNA methyltransferase [Calditrichaeota bacterium]|nr:MAG: class I SAM-dependent RNA methyltransferase [Calditrichota bacterium]